MQFYCELCQRPLQTQKEAAKHATSKQHQRQLKVFIHLFIVLMNETFGIQFNKKANCIRQHFVAIPATSGQLNVKFFFHYMLNKYNRKLFDCGTTIGSISKRTIAY